MLIYVAFNLRSISIPVQLTGFLVIAVQVSEEIITFVNRPEDLVKVRNKIGPSKIACNALRGVF